MSKYEYGRCEDCLYLNESSYREGCTCTSTWHDRTWIELFKCFVQMPIPLSELIDEK
jgi:hypothetical protein